MSGERTQQALARIEEALARIEAAAARPAPASSPEDGALRTKVADTLRDLDKLIGALES